MKFTRLTQYAAVILLAVAATACAKEDKAGAKQSAPAQVPTEVKMAYIDSDSILSKYNFAKDIMEANQRNQSKLESAYQQKANEIQRFQSEIEQKYKNNGYLTEDSFNADQQKLQQMNNDAQRYMGNLQNQLANESNLNAKQLQDSIDNCVNEYAKVKGISVVLKKEATFYVNGIPDITNDIVKILNERYNKVSEKTSK